MLSAGILLSCLPFVSASVDQLTDINGHWAQKSLEQAYTDGILKGTSSTTIFPNESVTKIQAVTILCRIFHVAGKGDTSSWNIPAGAWYAEDAAKGVYMGLLNTSDAETLNQPITRGDAILLFSKAFQNGSAVPDERILDQFPDSVFLAGELRRAAANLISDGVIRGIDGSLKLDQPLSRAEYVTILYRICSQYLDAESFEGQESGGTILSGNAALNGINASDLWFDQSSSQIHMSDVTARDVIVRSDNLENLTIDGSGSIKTLVLAAHSGDITVTVPESIPVETLIVGAGAGNVTISGAVSNVQVTGSSRRVSLDTDSLKNLIISGDGNSVSINTPESAVDNILISGAKNDVILNGSAQQLSIQGRDNAVDGSGRADTVSLQTRYYTLNLSHGTLLSWKNYDLSNVNVSLSLPSTLPAGETLRVSAQISCPTEDMGKLCIGSWYFNGELVSQEPVLLGKTTPVSDIPVSYHHDMDQKASVQFILSYENNDGEVFSQKVTGSVFLENFDDLGLADAVIRVNAPAVLPAGETLSVTAAVDTIESGKVCTGYWYVDGEEIAHGPLTLGAGPASMHYTYEYYDGMPNTSEITFKLTYITQDGRDQEISGSATVHLENYSDNGIAHASVTLEAPTQLFVSQQLNVTAHINYITPDKRCTGIWYVDGNEVSRESIILGKDIPSLQHQYGKLTGEDLASEIKFVLTCTTEDGREQEVAAATKLTLKAGPSFDEALRTVTSGYAGNYTLDWALNHDYTPEMKTAWVNAKGYSSKSQYLIWVNLTYQRVNIFQGSQGNWTLIRQALCGSGKSSTPTVRGVFATTYKQSSWNYGSYYCGPVVRFYGGYAFHSRLEYWPMGSGRYYDGRIGFPISHGCLRMYDDDIWWIYNNIPSGTTVVVY